LALNKWKKYHLRSVQWRNGRKVIVFLPVKRVVTTFWLDGPLCLNFKVFEFKFLHSLILKFLFLFLKVNFQLNSQSSLFNTIKNINESFSDINGPDKSLDSSECLLMSFGIF
jgi:hypothetical protein